MIRTASISACAELECTAKPDVSPPCCAARQPPACVQRHPCITTPPRANAFCRLLPEPNCVDKTNKNWLSRQRPLRDRKIIFFTLIINSHSSTNPENLAKVGPVDCVVIGPTEVVKIRNGSRTYSLPWAKIHTPHILRTWNERMNE